MSDPKDKDSGDILEISVEKISTLLTADYGLSKRTLALLLLQEDQEIISLVSAKEPAVFKQIMEIVNSTKSRYFEPLTYVIAVRRQEEAVRITEGAMEHVIPSGLSFQERLSRIMIHPLTGIPILIVILYYGIYQFVGKFGAGTVVDFIENDIFANDVNPWVTLFFTRLIPWQILRDLFVGEYGVITLGIRYAVAIILPIVTTFFIAFV